MAEVLPLASAEERLRDLLDAVLDEIDTEFEIENKIEELVEECSSDPALQALLIRRGLHFVMLKRLTQRRGRARRGRNRSAKWDDVRRAVEEGEIDFLAIPVAIGATGRWKPWGDWNFSDRAEDREFHARVAGAAGVRLEELDRIDAELTRKGARHNRELGVERLLAIRGQAEQRLLEAG